MPPPPGACRALLSVAVLEAAAAFSLHSYSQRGIWPHHVREIRPTSQPRRCRIGRSTPDPWRVRSGSEGALGRPHVSSSVEASDEWWEVRSPTRLLMHSRAFR